MLIDVKMPTRVVILTFISRINTIYECFKQKKLFDVIHHNFTLTIIRAVEISCLTEFSMKKRKF